MSITVINIAVPATEVDTQLSCVLTGFTHINRIHEGVFKLGVNGIVCVDAMTSPQDNRYTIDCWHGKPTFQYFMH